MTNRRINVPLLVQMQEGDQFVVADPASIRNGALVDADGNSHLRGPMVAATWMTIPSIFRLRITGTGTVTIDARDSLGNITLAVHVAVATAATDQIEFPYAGDDAVQIRATLGGTTTCEVI